MAYLDEVYAKWEKEIQEINTAVAGTWLNKEENETTAEKWLKARCYRVAAAMMSGSTLQYSRYPEDIKADLVEANHFVQKGACGLLQKSLALYREVFKEWKDSQSERSSTKN